MKLQLESKAFADRCVLGPIELEVAALQRVAITGRSGVGKTTLLRILAGLDVDWIGELDVGSLMPVSFMFQEPRLLHWKSAVENIALFTDDRLDAVRWLSDFGLSDAVNRFPHQLSGGMQRRVAMARALAVRPKCLLLDEPFASLDANNADACRALLRMSLVSLEASVIFVTHDPKEALALADRIIWLDGTPAIIADECPVRRSGDAVTAEPLFGGPLWDWLKPSEMS